MKAYLWFWGAFLLFFACLFPAFSISALSWPVALVDRSAPWLALLLLALSMVLWLTLLFAFLHYLLLGPPRALHPGAVDPADGEPRSALIEQAEQTGVQVRGFAQWKLQLSFKNLSGTPVREQMLVVDSKPQLHRFEAGRHIDARLGRTPGAFPNIVLDGAQPELNVASLWRRGIGAALGIAIVAAAYVWAYQLQSEGWLDLPVVRSRCWCARWCVWLCAGPAPARPPAARRCPRRCTEVSRHRRGGQGVEGASDRYLPQRTAAGGVPAGIHRPRRHVQQARVRRFIPLIELANIPREHVTLLYDPDDRSNVRLEGV